MFPQVSGLVAAGLLLVLAWFCTFFYWCYGYGSLESLFSAYVTAKADYWDYESTVSED